MNPAVRKWIYLIIGAIYFISPIDILPDVNFLARIDDLFVIGYLYFRYTKSLSQAHSTGNIFTEASQEEIQKPSSKQMSPYEILGLKQGASANQIEKQYKKLAKEYHPDKVNHLGKDLQELAHEKMVAIQDAYQKIKK